ncbi:MAG: Vms1/Ankzf1 family peptidyl-tRNA hydrolase [Vicinamibacterales bacterium]
MPSTDQLSAQLDRLASFDGGPYPVLSLYLNLQPNQHGRDEFDRFLRKELTERVGTYPAEEPERRSLEQDVVRIRGYLAEVDPSLNGLAIFACSAAGLFEAVGLAAPIGEHSLHIAPLPHLYPLTRLLDDYPRYAVLLADTNSARLFVVATNVVRETTTVEGTKTRRHKMGGWSQARYQRHIDHYHQQHAKEVVEATSRLMADESIEALILAGDEVILPLLRAEMPQALSDRVVDVLSLDIRAPEHEVLAATTELIRRSDATSDRARVEALLDAYRSGGLGVIGTEETERALDLGQVDELLIAGEPTSLELGEESPVSDRVEGGSNDPEPELAPAEAIADTLVSKARRTSARVTVIQDPSLLAPAGGVGALLRFRL